MASSETDEPGALAVDPDALSRAGRAFDLNREATGSRVERQIAERSIRGVVHRGRAIGQRHAHAELVIEVSIHPNRDPPLAIVPRPVVLQPRAPIAVDVLLPSCAGGDRRAEKY